jgi:ribosome maturation factor RimP
VSDQAGSVVGQVEAFAEPLLEDMGIELVDIEFRREGHGWVLRLYIDRQDGVTLDDCATVSREVSRYLEVEDPIEQAYHLEVSSPGLERPLKKEKDFARFSGRRARIKLLEKRDGQRIFTGTLAGMEDGVVLLKTETGVERFMPMEIARARLLFEEE